MLPTQEEEQRTFPSLLRNKYHNVPATCQTWKSHPTELFFLSSPLEKASSKQKKCPKDEKGELLLFQILHLSRTCWTWLQGGVFVQNKQLSLLPLLPCQTSNMSFQKLRGNSSVVYLFMYLLYKWKASTTCWWSDLVKFLLPLLYQKKRTE